MSGPALFLFGVGLVFLIVGANTLVRGAVSVAARLGIPTLVIGLTVVAFGTSTPEVLISVQAVLSGNDGIAIGNVLGSNIFNILFILGAAALLAPMVISRHVVRRDVPIVIAVSLIAFLLASDGRLTLIEGLVLLGGFVLYTTLLVRGGKSDQFLQEPKLPARSSHWFADIALVLVGLVLLMIGARWLVEGAVSIARVMGVSELVIGVTVVAAGTSLPELATSVVAGVRGQRDIAVGNAIGSNIFNLLCVLGAAAVVAPGSLEVPQAALARDFPVMIAVAILCVPLFARDYLLNRWEGFVMLGFYAAFTVFLVLEATHNAAAPGFARIVVLVVLPITALTFFYTTVRARDAAPQSPLDTTG